MKSITFITGNINKVEQTKRYLDIPLEHKKLDLMEIQSLDPKEVIEHKIQEAYNIINKPVLVEDTSVVIHALGRLPGPFIKWFLEELGPVGICKLVPNENRKATASVLFGLHDGKKIYYFEGKIQGTIATKPRGKNGFGWDPIFIPDGQNKTHAQMSDVEMDKISIRKIALGKMGKELSL
jgi:XTP/dITP diphosphohydrolase